MKEIKGIPANIESDFANKVLANLIDIKVNNNIILLKLLDEVENLLNKKKYSKAIKCFNKIVANIPINFFNEEFDKKRILLANSIVQISLDQRLSENNENSNKSFDSYYLNAVKERYEVLSNTLKLSNKDSLDSNAELLINIILEAKKIKDLGLYEEAYKYFELILKFSQNPLFLTQAYEEMGEIDSLYGKKEVRLDNFNYIVTACYHLNCALALCTDANIQKKLKANINSLDAYIFYRNIKSFTGDLNSTDDPDKALYLLNVLFENVNKLYAESDEEIISHLCEIGINKISQMLSDLKQKNVFTTIKSVEEFSNIHALLHTYKHFIERFYTCFIGNFELLYQKINIEVEFKGSKHQKKLSNARNKVKKTDEYKYEIISRQCNRDIFNTLEQIVSEAIETLGYKTFKFSVVLVGSGARNEFSPYSDIEFGIITDNWIDKKAIIKENHKLSEEICYYYALISLIRIKILSCGLRVENGIFKQILDQDERLSPIINEEIDQIDIEVNKKIIIHSPSGNEEKKITEVKNKQVRKLKGRLIGNIETFTKILYDDTDLTLPMVIQDLKPIYNNNVDESLFGQLITKIKELTQTNLKTTLPERLKEDLTTFTLTENYKDTLLDIKNDLLRFPYLYIKRLCMFAGIYFTNLPNDITSTEAGINKLIELKFLSPTEGLGLKEWFKFALNLRAKIHSYYDHEQDDFYYSKNEEGVFVLNENDKEILDILYQDIMLPIYEKARKWAINQTHDLNDLSKVISKLYLIKSNHLFKLFETTNDFEYGARANWYFEKAVEYNLEESRIYWENSITKLGKVSEKNDAEANNNEYIELYIDGKLTKIHLSEESIKQLNDQNNLEYNGRRNVRKIVINGHFFHIKEFPEDPMTEYMASTLTHMLMGYTTTPFSILAKFTRNNSSFPILISKSAIGINLEKALKKEKNILKDIDKESYGFAFFRQLYIYSADDQPSNFVLLPILSPDGNENKRRIICVDNDISFITCTFKPALLSYRILLKSILFCDVDLMKDIIDRNVVEKIIKHNPRELVEYWFNKVIQYCDIYNSLFAYNMGNVKISKGNELIDVQFTTKAKVNKGRVSNVYFKLSQIIDVFVENSFQINHFKLFYSLDSVTASLYNNYYTTNNVTTLGRFEELSKGQYDVIEINDLDTNEKIQRTQTKYNKSKMDSMQDEPIDATPEQSLNEFLNYIDTIDKTKIRREQLLVSNTSNSFSMLPIKLKEILINGKTSTHEGEIVSNIFGFHKNALKTVYKESNDLDIKKFNLEINKICRTLLDNIINFGFTKNFQRLNLSQCSILNENDLKRILNPNITWLDISDCTNLGKEALNIIAEKCPNLEVLYICDSTSTSSFQGKSSETPISNIFRYANIKSFFSIKRLYLNGANIDRKALYKIFNNSPNLQNIVSKNSRIDCEEEFENFQNDIADIEDTINNMIEFIEYPINWEHFISICYNKEEALKSFKHAKEKNSRTKKLLSQSNLNKILLLGKAVENDVFDLTETYLELGANPNFKNENGNTPLHIAVDKGNYNIVKLLLKYKAHINVKNDKGETPLHLLISKQSNSNNLIELVKILIQHGADVNNTNNDNYSIGESWVYYCKDLKVLEILSANHINLTIKRYLSDKRNIITGLFKNEEEPYITAIDKIGCSVNLNIKIVKLLFSYKQFPCKWGLANIANLLTEAIIANDIRFIEEFIEHINYSYTNKENFLLAFIITDEDYNNLFNLCYKYKRVNIYDILYDNYNKCLMPHSNYQEKMKYERSNFIYYLEEPRKFPISEADLKERDIIHLAILNNDLELLKHSFNFGLNYLPVDNKGNTYLHLAAENGNIDILNYLIYQRSLFNDEINKEGYTPLHLAIKHNHQEAITTLLRVNADRYKVNSKGWNAFHIAIIFNINSLTLIKEFYFNRKITTKDVDGNNILHLAAIYGHISIFEYVFSENKYKDFDNYNNQGLSVIELAFLNGHDEIIKLLQKNGIILNISHKKPNQNLLKAQTSCDTRESLSSFNFRSKIDSKTSNNANTLLSTDTHNNIKIIDNKNNPTNLNFKKVKNLYIESITKIQDNYI
ncbi:MAG: ankyrin repeat domain-containing protein [Sphingobacteriia bacterium]|nr:ankyrin repeat domain-containing protein [Sphingobacteriia bacterium]